MDGILIPSSARYGMVGNTPGFKNLSLHKLRVGELLGFKNYLFTLNNILINSLRISYNLQIF